MEDSDSDSDESVVDEDRPEPILLPWMMEAARGPNARVEANISRLGSRDIDMAYNWHANAPPSPEIEVLKTWLNRTVRETGGATNAMDIEEVDYRTLQGPQRDVFLQVMAYYKALAKGLPVEPLRINIDGTAGTGKSYLIAAISTGLRDLALEEGFPDPCVRLAPTGIAAFNIRGWTLHFGLKIQAKHWEELTPSALQKVQETWNQKSVMILDEKSMVGRTLLGKADR